MFTNLLHHFPFYILIHFFVSYDHKFLKINGKKYIIEVYLLKYYFESHLIYECRYYRQTIFSQLNIMVPYVDIIDLCHSVAIL